MKSFSLRGWTTWHALIKIYILKKFFIYRLLKIEILFYFFLNLILTIFLVHRFKYKFNQASFHLFVVVEEKKQSFEIRRNQSRMRDDGYDEKSLKVVSKKQRSSKLESET